MRNVVLLNPSIASTNMGDRIIETSVRQYLYQLFPQDFICELPTQDPVGPKGRKLLQSASFAFVGGTNLLSSEMNNYNQWKINALDAIKMRNVILMGVGWWQYQHQANTYTRILLRQVLNHKFLHSVRDSYTESKLREMGFDNVLNTSCPTVWSLTPEHCATIPRHRASEVVMTLTDYKPDAEQDRQLINILLAKYEFVHMWVQGTGDVRYVRELIQDPRILLVNPSVEAFNHLLATRDVDYVGTRLHAGIRAIQHRRRTLIVSVDNRATEISRDIGLNVIERADIGQVQHFADNEVPMRITLPVDNIKRWMSQFRLDMDATAPTPRPDPLASK